MERRLMLLFCLITSVGFSQRTTPHLKAHAHNDYEHAHPLMDALQNGFISVEADVWWQNESLFVLHDRPKQNAGTLEKLYLAPLDSLLKMNDGRVYKSYKGLFYLMIDCKSDSTETYDAIKNAIAKYSSLVCSKTNCPVKIFLSGNRPMYLMLKEGVLGIDGRPSDLGKGYSVEAMPVISDDYRNQSRWDGKSMPLGDDTKQIRELAKKTHAEGKKLRLWAIPDSEIGWDVLLQLGVDLINTDHLVELNAFMKSKGL